MRVDQDRSPATWGLVFGRFQPLHIGHMEYLQAAKARCHRLVVGVTTPDPRSAIDDHADPNRSKASSNPFTYFERLEMITGALVGEGWDRSDFVVLPADINRPETLPPLLPNARQSVAFLTVYDAWGEKKAEVLSQLGYDVDILWRRDMSERVATGSAIRAAMRSQEQWQHLVPIGIAEYFERRGLPSQPDH